MNLSKQAKMRCVLASSASAVGTNATSVVDMQNFEGVFFFGKFGTIGAGTRAGFYLQGSTTSSTGFDALTGTMVDITTSQDNYVFGVDVYKPSVRYIRGLVVCQPGTATPYGDVYMVQYGPRAKSVLNSTSGRTQALAASGQIVETHVSPAVATSESLA